QFGPSQSTRFINDGPEPFGGLQNMQRGINTSLWRGRIRRYIASIMIEPHNISHRASVLVSLMTRMIRVSMRAFEQLGDCYKHRFIVNIAILGASALENGYSYSMALFVE